MSLFKQISELDNKFSWSFFGFLLAIVLGLVTFYDRVLVDKHPQLFLDVLTSTSVLDIKEQLPNLKISYNDIDIREKDLSLRILTVKAINDSSKNILKEYYDPEDPVGFRVTSGKIIRTELVNSSNDYLKRNLTFLNTTNSTIHFNDVIVDAHESFTLKLLILQPANESVTIEPVGYISGMQKIIVREPFKETGRSPFLTSTFSGSLIIQITRLIAYTLLTIIVILLIVIPTVQINEKLQELRRKKHVRDFKAATDIDLTEIDEFIFGRYINIGSRHLLKLNELCDDDELEQAYDHYKSPIGDKGNPDDRLQEEFGLFTYTKRNIKSFIVAGFIEIKDEKACINQHMKQTLEHFIRYLRNRQIIGNEDDERALRFHALEEMTAEPENSHVPVKRGGID